jgi:hypothetical protein
MTVQITHSYSCFKLIAKRNSRHSPTRSIKSESKRSKPFFVKRKEQKQKQPLLSLNINSTPTIQSSAPECVYISRNIIINGDNHHILLPEEFDIYEGLRLWYPNLYEAVMEEETNIRYQEDIPTEETLTEEDYEEAWAHLDYLEWLRD